MSDAPMSLPLVFDVPRRGRPPRHLADLDPAERRAAVEELGEPAYRAGQLAQHYFVRLVDDPAAMTDLPGRRARRLAERAAAAAADRRSATCAADGGTTRKTLWRLHDGALVE